MALIHVHSTDSVLPNTVRAPHEGFWTYDLQDGSYLLIVRVWHAAAGRKHFIDHAPAARVLPSVRSTAPLHPDTVASLRSHTGATIATAYDALTALQEKQPWEPMLDPDSA